MSNLPPHQGPLADSLFGDAPSSEQSVAWDSLLSEAMPTSTLRPNDLMPNGTPINDAEGEATTDAKSDEADKDTRSLIESIEAKKRISRLQNTAASTRFRQRRKQREEELTEKLEVMRSKWEVMEDSMKRLTVENDLLKELLSKGKGAKGLLSSRQRKKKSSSRAKSRA